MIFRLLIANIYLLILGFSALKLMTCHKFQSIEEISLSYFIGVMLTSFGMLLMNFLNFKYTFQSLFLMSFLMLCLLVFVIIINNTKKNQIINNWNQSLEELKSLILFFKQKELIVVAHLYLVFIFLFVMAIIFYEAMLRPLYTWDAMSFWVVKSKVMYFKQMIDWNDQSFINVNAHNPLNVPLIQVWFAYMQGGFDEMIIKWFYPVNTFFFSMIFFSHLKYWTQSLYALIGIIIFATIPFVCFHSTIAYSDLLVCYYFNIGTFYLFKYMNKNNNDYGTLWGVCCLGAYWTKPESILFVGIEVIIIIFYFIKERKKITTLVLFLLKNISLFVIFYLFWNQWIKTLGFSDFKYHSLIPHIDRLIPIIGSFLESFFTYGNWGVIGIFFMLVVGISYSKIIKSVDIYLFITIILLSLGFMYIYTFIVENQFKFRDVSFNRVVVTLVPMILFSSLKWSWNYILSENIQIINQWFKNESQKKMKKRKRSVS